MGIDSDCMGMERDGNVKLCRQLPVIWTDTPLNRNFSLLLHHGYNIMHRKQAYEYSERRHILMMHVIIYLFNADRPVQFVLATSGGCRHALGHSLLIHF